MYSRSLDPRRISSIPNHYGGSAFRSDGTPTPIPVRREHPRISESESASGNDTEASAREETTAEMSPVSEIAESAPAVIPSEDTHTHSEASATGDGNFFSRVFGNMLPGIRDDDILLILLIFLFSREPGNEDVLLLLAFLLFGA